MTKSVPNNSVVYLKLLVTCIFWGGTFVAARYIVLETTPLVGAALRFLIAGAVLLAVFAWKNGISRSSLPKGRQWRGILFLSFTGIFMYNAFFMGGLRMTSAASGALIVAVNPIATALMAVIYFKERFRKLQLIGLVLSFIGVLVVMSRGSLTALMSLDFDLGYLVLIGAPVCWAIYSVYGRTVMAELSPLTTTLFATLCGTAMLIPAALLEIVITGINPDISWKGWLAILQLAILGTVIGFVWWYDGIKKIGPSRASAFLNLVPLFGVSFAGLILGETLGTPHIIGGALIICGVFIWTKFSVKEGT